MGDVDKRITAEECDATDDAQSINSWLHKNKNRKSAIANKKREWQF
jgi:hypothetical protein